MATMRAMAVERFGGVEELREMQLDPPLVGPDYVLIRIAAAGVNPVDALIRSGALTGAFPHVLPVIPGWDAAGTVEAVGPAVSHVGVGDRVLAYCRKDLVQGGTYAELVAVRDVHVALSGNMDPVAAAGLPLAGLTAYQSLHDALGVHSGETIVVRGASGGVGHFAVQLAQAAGAYVVAVAGGHAESFVRGLGAEDFVDHRGGDVVGSLRSLLPDGADAFLDIAGGELSEFLPVLRDGGRMASILVTQVPEGAVSRNIAFRYVFVRPDAHQLAEMVALADSGRLRVEVARAYPLAEAAAAQSRLAEGGVRGKIVLEI